MQKPLHHLLRTAALALCMMGATALYAQTTDGQEHHKAATRTFLPGDVNGDGLHSLSDLVMMVNYILGAEVTGYVEEASDLTGDGVTSVQDVVTLINIILGNSSVPHGDDANPVIPVGNPEGGDPADGV